jgi:hypothetical protein
VDVRKVASFPLHTLDRWQLRQWNADFTKEAPMDRSSSAGDGAGGQMRRAGSSTVRRYLAVDSLQVQLCVNRPRNLKLQSGVGKQLRLGAPQPKRDRYYMLVEQMHAAEPVTVDPQITTAYSSPALLRSGG